jgi:hypothetical protein
MAVEPASMFCGAGSFRLFENDTHSLQFAQSLPANRKSY